MADSNKINWYFSDLPVNWKTMTHENYLKGFTPFKRDSIMAINIIENYKILFHAKKTESFSNHEYKSWLCIIESKLRTGIQWLDGSTTNYLIKALPGKVANVMINTTSGLFTPIQYGEMETSFKIAGNPNVGFNFKGSLLPMIPGTHSFLNSKSLSYKDIFTRFIFYTPLNEQVKKTGYPYELDNFEDTLLKGLPA